MRRGKTRTLGDMLGRPHTSWRELFGEWMMVCAVVFLAAWPFAPVEFFTWLVGMGVALLLMASAFIASPIESRLRSIFRRRAEVRDPNHELKIDSPKKGSDVA